MTRSIIALGLLLPLLPVLLHAGSGPKITFATVEHDFGDVKHGESPSVELSFTNTGDDVLVVNRIESSCGCAKAIRGNRRLSPGESSKIYAQIDTLGMPPGRHRKTLTVRSNDPAHPLTSLKLIFCVVRHVTLSPHTLATCLSESDKEAVFSMKATNHWTAPVTLRACKSTDTQEILMIPAEVVVPPGGAADFQISIRVTQAKGQPYLMGTTWIETDDPFEKALSVRYFLQLRKAGG